MGFQFFFPSVLAGKNMKMGKRGGGRDDYFFFFITLSFIYYFNILKF